MSEHPLRRYRKTRGLSLKAMGEIVGVSKVTIWSIENGSHHPSLALMQKFVDLTDLKADDFLRQRATAAE